MKKNHFKGKCLSISLKDDNYNHDLIDPIFENIGEKLFLIGKIPPGATDSNWSKGNTGAVAWERVYEYIVFDSVEEYQKATKKSEEHEEKSKQRKKKKKKKN